jgi:hypothetical protein
MSDSMQRVRQTVFTILTMIVIVGRTVSDRKRGIDVLWLQDGSGEASTGRAPACPGGCGCPSMRLNGGCSVHHYHKIRGPQQS